VEDVRVRDVWFSRKFTNAQETPNDRANRTAAVAVIIWMTFHFFETNEDAALVVFI